MYSVHVIMEGSNLTKGFTAESAGLKLLLEMNCLDVLCKVDLKIS